MSSYIPKALRDEVTLKKGGICGICKKPIVFGQEFDVDHIYPETKGGRTVFDNLHCAHCTCNKKKVKR